MVFMPFSVPPGKRCARFAGDQKKTFAVGIGLEFIEAGRGAFARLQFGFRQQQARLEFDSGITVIFRPGKTRKKILRVLLFFK